MDILKRSMFVCVHVLVTIIIIVVNSACVNNRGGCSRICLPRPDGSRICACPGGFDLLPNGIGCGISKCLYTLHTYRNILITNANFIILKPSFDVIFVNYNIR
jgi:hypothetical protein